MSQVVGYFMKNNQHKILHLLHLLTTFYVKVDFFQILTFWSTLGYRQRSNHRYDSSEIRHESSTDPKEPVCRFLSKSHWKGFHYIYCAGFFVEHTQKKTKID